VFNGIKEVSKSLNFAWCNRFDRRMSKNLFCSSWTSLKAGRASTGSRQWARRCGCWSASYGAGTISQFETWSSGGESFRYAEPRLHSQRNPFCVINCYVGCRNGFFIQRGRSEKNMLVYSQLCFTVRPSNSNWTQQEYNISNLN
jgi:hypothetical protein